MLFAGGYLLNSFYISYVLEHSMSLISGYSSEQENLLNFMYYPLIEGIMYGLIIGFKSCLMIFIFI